jgi:predicted ribosomally synthesized peptide with SipW-like signal peptide
MTKLKSKKMTKSTFAVIIMAVLLVAMLAFGGTYAYFTAEATQDIKGSVTTATVQLNGGSEVTITVDEFLLPGATIVADNSLQVTNKSNVGTYIFAIVTVTAKDADEAEYDAWEYEDGVADKDKVPYTIAKGDFTALADKKDVFYVDASTNIQKDAVLKLGEIKLNDMLKGHSEDTDLGAGMNITFTIEVEYVSIQADIDGVTDAAGAFAQYETLRGAVV